MLPYSSVARSKGQLYAAQYAKASKLLRNFGGIWSRLYLTCSFRAQNCLPINHSIQHAFNAKRHVHGSIELALLNKQHNVLDNYIHSILHSPMPNEERIKLLNNSQLSDIILKSASKKNIRALIDYECFDTNIWKALLQRSLALNDHESCFKVAVYCVENEISLPLKLIHNASLILLKMKKLPISFLLFKLVEFESTRSEELQIEELLRVFYEYLVTYLTSISVSQPQSQNNYAIDIVNILSLKQFKPLIFLHSFHTIDIDYLNIHISKLCIDSMIIAIKQQLDKDVAAVVKDIRSKSHGFVILVSSSKSESGEFIKLQILEYLKEKHNITSAEFSEKIVLSRQEILINRCYSAIRVSAVLRASKSQRKKNGIPVDPKNPLIIYISATEVIQSLYPDLPSSVHATLSESIADGGDSSNTCSTSLYKYSDVIGDSTESTLQRIVYPHYDRLCELQLKRNIDEIKGAKAALDRFKRKHAAIKNRTRKQSMMRQILDLDDRVSKL